MKSQYDTIHEWLCIQYDVAKQKNKLAHKNNDKLKKERARGEMLAFKKAFIKVQKLRSEN